MSLNQLLHRFNYKIHIDITDNVIKKRILTLSVIRSEEHTSELQSQSNLVCRLLLEKKKKQRDQSFTPSIIQRRSLIELYPSYDYRRLTSDRIGITSICHSTCSSSVSLPDKSLPRAY